jgi:BTB/POZ domain
LDSEKRICAMKMAVELLTFDPDGDLLLVLADGIDKEDSTESNEEDDGTIEQKATQISLPDIFSSTTLSDIEGNSYEPLELEPQKSRKEIHMLVSSKHLMLASPVFKAMLQHNNFKEGDMLRSSGQVKVPLPDDDPTALKILLDIVHGRVRQVPRQVNLKVMTELSVLVDKYQMLEVVELYAEVWMNTLKTSVPMFFTADLLAWLSISWVFGLADIFKQISRIAMRGSTNLFGAHESHLPIPQPVFGKSQQFYQRQTSDLTTYSGYLGRSTEGYSRCNCCC